MNKEIKPKDIGNILDNLTKLSNYVEKLQTPEEYFKHMQGHRTELSLVLCAFELAKYSKDIIELIMNEDMKKNMEKFKEEYDCIYFDVNNKIKGEKYDS